MDPEATNSSKQSLVQAGLTPEQAGFYEALVASGPLPASKIAQKAHISRTLGYKVLGELEALGLVIKDDQPGKVALFTAAHPLKLKEVAEKRLEQAKDAKAALEGTLGKLISTFNLAGGRPGIEFYEGLPGVQQVLEDSLTAQSEIYTYADIESIEKYISDINKEYVRDREKLGIRKKGIALDTPFARKFLEGYAPSVTEMKLIKYDVPSFHTVMQIYDGKISYITLSEQNLIGVIIADQRIYEMHRDLFLYMWNTTPELSAAHQV
jgi:sugar-specific transcriptional regulator TrmB